ncbi:hypothetical protein Ndes2437B_g07119 [Nannochloris sp. 'desiccata']
MDPATYHPSGSGAGGNSLPAPQGIEFPGNANGNHATTLDDHPGMILQSSDLEPGAPAAAATVTAVADTGTPLDSSQPGPSSLSLMASPASARGNASGSAKSQRIIEKLVCQVDECQAPLEGLKDYHQRYKVCDTHLKIEWIEREGNKVRFCQQCGRFQPLEDFDGLKRSCRTRLDKHNARRRKRNRDGRGASGDHGTAATAAAAAAAAGMYLHHYDPAAQAAIAAGFNPVEVAAMQEAMQFASATLMQTTAAQGGGLPVTTTTDTNTDANGAANTMLQPANVDIEAATASASIAGMPFGGTLQSMPFIPSKEVMALLLKGYAGMFHYSIESMHLKPRAPPTSAEELSAPMEAAAAAAAAAMTAATEMHGNESAAAHLMAIQAQQAAAAADAGGGGGVGDEYGDAAAAAAAAAGAEAVNSGNGVNVAGAGMFNLGSGGQGHVGMSTLPPSIQ